VHIIKPNTYLKLTTFYDCAWRIIIDGESGIENLLAIYRTDSLMDFHGYKIVISGNHKTDFLIKSGLSSYVEVKCSSKISPIVNFRRALSSKVFDDDS